MLDWGRYNDRVRDLTPRNELLAPGSTPFDSPFVYRSSSLQFNIADYGHTLLTEFLQSGGKLKHAEFHTPADLAALAEPVVINCTGYGARALWGDRTITPVRGQIAWLAPQPEVRYGLYYRQVTVLPRPDGIVVQYLGGGDMWGYGVEDERPDRAEAEAAVATIARLFGGGAA